MASNSTVIDADALQALREILMDTDETEYAYSTERILLALRDNRQTVLFRDPGYAASGVNPYLWYRGKTHVPESDPDTSQLVSEQDKRNFQAPRYFRHWDSQGTVQVWVNGVVKTLTTDYTVDYAQGRVTFTADVNDWQTVNATATYYRIYHAAKDILIGSLAMGGGEASIRLGTDSFVMRPVKDLIAAVESMIGNITSRNVRFTRKMY